MNLRYNRRLAHIILGRISTGESLRAICADEKMPDASTVLRWAAEDRDGFQKAYALAMDIRAQLIAEEALELADASPAVATGAPGTGEATARVQAQKLRVDTRKWLLARMAPKRYGDRIAQEISGPGGGPIHVAEAMSPEAEAKLQSYLDDLRAGLVPPGAQTEPEQ